MQLLLFLALVFLIASVIAAKKSTFSRKAKGGLFIVLALLLILAWWYEARSRQNSEENRLMINAFKQGKSLYCDGREISSDSFVFVNGTLSFIANDKNQNDRGIVIDIATCKLEKTKVTP
jgi:membrane protein implicated in regulation of membrane protease activity